MEKKFLLFVGVVLFFNFLFSAEVYARKNKISEPQQQAIFAEMITPKFGVNAEPAKQKVWQELESGFQPQEYRTRRVFVPP